MTVPEAAAREVVKTNPFKAFTQQLGKMFFEKGAVLGAAGTAVDTLPTAEITGGGSISDIVPSMIEMGASLIGIEVTGTSTHSGEHSSGHSVEHSQHSGHNTHQQHHHYNDPHTQASNTHNAHNTHNTHDAHGHGQQSHGQTHGHGQGSHGQYQLSPYFEKAVEIINTAAGIIVMASVLLAGVNLILVAINANFGKIF